MTTTAAGRIVKRHMDDKQLTKHFDQLYKYLDERFDGKYSEFPLGRAVPLVLRGRVGAAR